MGPGVSLGKPPGAFLRSGMNHSEPTGIENGSVYRNRPTEGPVVLEAPEIF